MEPDAQPRSGVSVPIPAGLRRRSDRKATTSRDPQESRRFLQSAADRARLKVLPRRSGQQVFGLCELLHIAGWRPEEP